MGRSKMSQEVQRKIWRDRSKKRYQRGIKILRRFKLMKGCKRCGFKEHHASLHFHHKNPDEKSFQIGNEVGKMGFGRHSKSKIRLKEEMGKCEILCANCHARVTFEEKHWRKDLYGKH